MAKKMVQHGIFVGGSATEAIGPSPSDRTLLQIGRLTYRLGMFEYFLDLLLRGKLSGGIELELERVAKWPAGHKIAQARKHCGRLSNRAHEGLLLRGLEVAEKAYAVRNHVLHGTWQINPEEAMSVSKNPARGDLERHGVDVDKAAESADAALRLIVRVTFLEAGLGEPPFPFPFYSRTPQT